jgi:hypothetical protein
MCTFIKLPLLVELGCFWQCQILVPSEKNNEDVQNVKCMLFLVLYNCVFMVTDWRSCGTQEITILLLCVSDQTWGLQ